ncbi:FAD-dependent oxidoreductase [uncultured Azohydromonas sp.]|jgi:2-polyprenyl-6-methoxyphenol hydroxylase and related FAD-dependent oxidoreductases|uniref:FAD-dependent oxidoreductase n=1 Tax=uncultured Azohydromonas sp. TaxID=487342 RepID=UPI0026223CC6|nr:FAD-dependent oxidoreductase [uncultured Azohydromonas sp.]
MLKTYTYPKFEYRRPPELDGGAVRRLPVVIVGAGPVGMAAALDCRLHGIPVVVLDDDDTVSVGSRGLCYAKRALEILDRIGVGDPVVDKGVGWNVGRTFFGEGEVFNFNLQPEADQKRPGMVNLQQYYLEEYQVAKCRETGVEIRWKNKVIAVTPQGEHVSLQVQTPDGVYELETDWLIVCDGARSPIRTMLGLDIDGKVFMDRFLIADVVMKAAFPAERWFWFDPPFHRNQSVLLHREADDVWRIDFQLGWNVDPEEEKKPEKVIPRIKAMLGDDREFELEWVSVYTFQCRRMGRFNHGRVLFAGDAAHQVSPFGARGANSGIQDTDNLVWKLKLVMDGLAPERLLDTYSEERVYAADENIMNSTRSTDFITPKSNTSKAFRNAVLQLAQRHAFARKLVNSGRLSVPAFYSASSLNTPDTDEFNSHMVPGAPMEDAPIAVQGKNGWLLDQVGNRFQLLVYADDASTVDRALLAALCDAPIPVEAIVVSPRPADLPGVRVIQDLKGLVAQRYDARDGSAFLLRPDQHLAARWRGVDAAKVRQAVARATCNA